jgi:hypothetical protein
MEANGSYIAALCCQRLLFYQGRVIVQMMNV